MDQSGDGAGVEPPIVNIVGDRVALGPHRRDLLPTYQRWINDFGFLRTLGVVPPGPMTLEQEAAWYEGQAANEVRFTIYERAIPPSSGQVPRPSGQVPRPSGQVPRPSGQRWRPIGTTRLGGIDHRNRTAGFGIGIGEPDARGKGYGTEATRLMLDYAFTALGLHSVMLVVAEFNLAGRRAYEKAGFREFGRRRQCRWLAGRLWDDVYMDCLATEFVSPVLARVFVPDESRT